MRCGGAGEALGRYYPARTPATLLSRFIWNKESVYSSGCCVVCVVSDMLKTEEKDRRVGCRKTYVRTFCLRCIRVGCMFSTIILTEGLAIFDEERVFLPTTSCE